MLKQDGKEKQVIFGDGTLLCEDNTLHEDGRVGLVLRSAPKGSVGDELDANSHTFAGTGPDQADCDRVFLDFRDVDGVNRFIFRLRSLRNRLLKEQQNKGLTP